MSKSSLSSSHSCENTADVNRIETVPNNHDVSTSTNDEGAKSFSSRNKRRRFFRKRYEKNTKSSNQAKTLINNYTDFSISAQSKNNSNSSEGRISSSDSIQESLLSCKNSFKNEAQRKATKTAKVANNRTPKLKKCFSKPIPRAAPCITYSFTDSSSSNENGLFYQDVSDCDSSYQRNKNCSWRSESMSCISGGELNNIRMMKAKMIKLEDTIELMYKKFKLHEDNIDEMQVKRKFCLIIYSIRQLEYR